MPGNKVEVKLTLYEGDMPLGKDGETVHVGAFIGGIGFLEEKDKRNDQMEQLAHKFCHEMVIGNSDAGRENATDVCVALVDLTSTWIYSHGTKLSAFAKIALVTWLLKHGTAKFTLAVDVNTVTCADCSLQELRTLGELAAYKP